MEGSKVMVKNKTFKEIYEDSLTYDYGVVWVSEQANLSYRQTLRKIKAIKNNTYTEYHKLKGESPNRKSSIDKIAVVKEYLDMGERINAGMKNRIPNFTFAYFYRNHFSGKQLMSLATFKRIMAEALVQSPFAIGETKKKYKKILEVKKANIKIIEKADITKEEKIEIEEKIKVAAGLVYEIRPRHAKPPKSGMIIQMDACKDYWGGDEKIHVHIAKDIALNKTIALTFDKEETTNAYYIVLKQIIEEYGIPEIIRVDQRSSFIVNSKKHCVPEKEALTQFGFICQLLRIKLEANSEPTFKGSVERHFRTMLSEMAQEMRLQNINTIELANSTKQKWINFLNNNHALKNEIETVYKKYSLDLSIDHLFSIREFRIVDNGGSISYHNKFLSMYYDDNRVVFKEGTRVLVERTLDGRLYASISKDRYELKETLYEDLKYGQKLDFDNKRIIRPSYSQKDEHPWSYMSFLVYLEKIKNRTHYLKGL